MFFTSTRAMAVGASEDSASGDSASKGCGRTTGAGGCNLYEDDLAGSGSTLTQKLIAVSSGTPNPEVQGVARISEDGSHIYFVAKGVLTGAAENAYGERASAGADNLYAFEHDPQFPAGRTSFIATLGPSDEGLWATVDGRAAQASRNGHFFVFASASDPTDEGTAPGIRQIYVYDAQQGRLARASIGQDGYNSNGRLPLYSATLSIGPGGRSLPYAYAGADSPVAAGGSLAPDDGAVFFASPTALTPQALNNQVALEYPVLNIYEYENGNVYLISDGQDTSTVDGSPASGLVGASASGEDVFFATVDPLIALDTDTQQDIYDARVGGGAPPPVVSPGCSEDACQGPLGGSVTPLIAGSSSQAPGGNLASNGTAPKVVSKRKPKTTKRKIKRKRSKKGRNAVSKGHRHVRREL